MNDNGRPSTIYRVDKVANRIVPLKETDYVALGNKERPHLQEWICHEVNSLNDESELLVVQKELSAFEGTKERLDLLALDSSGKLVVIENKRDDSGSDVVWQALKYASYVSSMSFDDMCGLYAEYLKKDGKSETVETVRQQLLDFLEKKEDEVEDCFNHEQRIILVAHHFRPEVTTTALWLRKHKIDVRCVEAVPYLNGNDVFIDFNTLVPSPTVEQVEIRREQASESSSGKPKLYRDFWSRLIDRLGRTGEISPTSRSYLTIGPYCSFCFSRNGPRIEAYIDKFDKTVNDRVFNGLLANKEAIEKEFGDGLSWEALEMKRACRIAYYLGNETVSDTSKWSSVIDKMKDCVPKFEKVVSERVAYKVNEALE